MPITYAKMIFLTIGKRREEKKEKVNVSDSQPIFSFLFSLQSSDGKKRQIIIV
jgi:hypothetical protein